jgi:beta-lactamase regulating signal transducer with metallopeptidase domain
MTAPALQALAEILTQRLLNTIVEGILIAGVAWILLRLVGRQNSGTRFAVWFSTLVSIAALPLLSGSIGGRVHAQATQGAALHGIALSSSWARYLFTAWCAGAVVLLVRLSVGLLRVRDLRKNCAEVDFGSELAGVDPAILATLQRPVSRRRVRVCVSNEVAVPAATGFFRPAIVFPAPLLPQLSVSETEVILLHELAHLRRWDDWTNLAQKILKALFFFHPAVWWIESRLTLEREMACDDMVLAQTTSPRAYASSLVSFAEKLQSARALTLAQALVSRMHQMSQRVSQILDAKRPSHTGLWKPAAGVSAGLLALIFGATPYVPQLVAFRAPAAQRQSTYATPQAARTLEPNPRASIPVAERPDSQKQIFAHAKAIQASFHPRTALVPRQLRSAPRTPAMVRTRTAQPQIPVQETIFILRTSGYDAFGTPNPQVWTLCIWTTDQNSLANRQLESAIVLGLI